MRTGLLASHVSFNFCLPYPWVQFVRKEFAPLQVKRILEEFHLHESKKEVKMAEKLVGKPTLTH